MKYYVNFFPGVTCLGDSLKKLGYSNTFLGGAHPTFAAKGSFLRDHGYDERYGKKEWAKTGKYSKDDLTGWGLKDDNLFTEARSKLDQLVKKNKPFNLTILTLNNHPPEGYQTKNCKNGQFYENKVKCSSNEIANFIQYVKDKNYLKNTNIVILGDHLSSAKTPVLDKLNKIKNRTIYNSWISQDKFSKNREKILHFDFAPSILEFIGFDIKNHKYGLGYSGFAKTAKKFDENRDKTIEQNVLKDSKFYFTFWKEKKK